MKIIPQPQKLLKISGNFTIDNDCFLFCSDRFSSQAKRLADMIYHSCKITVTLTDEIDRAKIIFNSDDNIPREGYHIMLSQGDLATVTASDVSGCYYAVETLRQMFNLDAEQERVTCANCYVEDAPKYAYRGLHVDVCRHFFGVDVIKQIIELMSQDKLNKLHLHLTDDQGFRIEIDKYPLLTEISAVRDGSEVTAGGKTFIDEQPHGGYYTKDDIREIVRYASEHNVEVIPEVDVPGHMVAALAAYPEYGCNGTPIEVRKTWGISKDILCAGNDATYGFVCDILDEVCELFPSEYFHLGGDEAPKDRWCNCKACREKLAELQLSNFEQLQTYMVEVFRKHLEAKGKTVICWNDGITADSDKEIICQVWKPRTTKSGIKEANNGRKIIMSPFFRTYFDYPYGMTPLKRTYNFRPNSGVKKSCASNVLGVEGCVWTERIADTDKLFFNLLPRLDALSECAWGYRGAHFSKRLKKRFELYDKAGLTYNGDASLSDCRKLGVIRKFFKKDANVELNKYKNKR